MTKPNDQLPQSGGSFVRKPDGKLKQSVKPPKPHDVRSAASAKTNEDSKPAVKEA